MATFLGFPKVMFLDNNGIPMVNGKVATYSGGTSTPLATYPTIADANTGTNANANPTLLDSRGEAVIVLTAQSYKFTLQDSLGNTIWTVDNYVAATGGGGGGGSVTQVLDSAGFVVFNGTGTVITIGGTDTTAMALAAPTITASGSTSLTIDAPVCNFGNSTAATLNFKIGSATLSSITATAASWGTNSTNTTSVNGVAVNVAIGSTNAVYGGASIALGNASTTAINALVGTSTILTATGSALVLGSAALSTTTVGGVAITVGTSATTSITGVIGANTYLTMSSSGFIGGYSGTTHTLNGTNIILGQDSPISDSSGNEYLSFSKITSATNQFQITNAATGTYPTLSASGTDTNIGLLLSVKGNAPIRAMSNAIVLISDQPIQDSSTNPYLAFIKTTTAVNSFTITNSATGNAPKLAVTGSDTNITMSLAAKGTGNIILTSTAVQLANNQNFLDSNGNIMETNTAVASAVNYINISNNTTMNSPTVGSNGSDVSVSLAFQNKGVSSYNFLGTTGTPATLNLYEQTTNGNTFAAIQCPASLASSYNITLPTALPGSTQYMQMSAAGAISFTSSTSGTITQLYDTATNVVIDGTGTVLKLGATDTTSITATIAGNSYFSFTSGALTFGYSSATMTLNGTKVILGNDQFIADSSGNSQLSFVKTSTAVNQWTMTNAATGSGVQLTATGTDTNIGATVKSKGSGALSLNAGTGNVVLTGTAIQLASTQSLLDANGNALLSGTAITSSVNNIKLTNAATTTNPIISAAGSDTNIGIDLQCKGTGVTRLLAVAATSGQLEMFQANSSTQYVGLAAPTSGVTAYTAVLPATAPTVNQVLTAGSSTATNLVWAPPSGGNFVLIGSAVASSSATLAFTGLTTTYAAYFFYLSQIIPATNATGLQAQLGTGSTTYFTTSVYQYAGNTMAAGSTTITGQVSAGTTSMPLTNVSGTNSSTTTHGLNGTCWLLGVGSNFVNPGIIATMSYYNTAPNLAFDNFNGALVANAETITAIRFQMSSGNISSGTIYCWGVK